MKESTAERLEQNIKRCEDDLSLRDKIQGLITYASQQPRKPLGITKAAQWEFLIDELTKLLK